MGDVALAATRSTPPGVPSTSEKSHIKDNAVPKAPRNSVANWADTFEGEEYVPFSMEWSEEATPEPGFLPHEQRSAPQVESVDEVEIQEDTSEPTSLYHEQHPVPQVASVEEVVSQDDLSTPDILCSDASPVRMRCTATALPSL